MKRWGSALVLAMLAHHVMRAQPAATPAVRHAPQAPSAAAPAPPSSTPESVGLGSDRLARLHRTMQGFVDRREAAGIVTLIAREGKVVDVHAAGFQDLDSRSPLKGDTIFRIMSMTKPITSVAVMMLVEEGKLLLTDPVSKFIPSFKGQKVMEGTATVPAQREPTIRDLLTHRSGLTYGFLNGGAVGNAYRRSGVTDGFMPTEMTTAEGIDRLAAQPLMAQPGAAWNYGLSTDALGRVVEVASGMAFDAFLRERIFAPLGMTDTDFVVADAKWPRVATVYTPEGSGIRPMKDPESIGNTHLSPVATYKVGRRYMSGGAGLTSTARDYWRFAQMLLNGGALNRVRLLSPTSIELMTANHTWDLPPSGLLGPGTAFGLGFRVVTDVAPTQTHGSVGMYGWLGLYGTAFWIDPKEQLVAIMLVQKYPGSTVAGAFQPLVYQAITRKASAAR
jgi:CubicO group peptidase (beta-lactamase class C family)